MRRNPKTVTADDLEAVLFGLGFVRRSGKSDHRLYTHPELSHPLVVDPNRPHLKRYVWS
jgi:predicted RNA binding protein YcfA (HicA-like mRNA interferase family)